MSLKWKTAFILFISSLIIIPLSTEYLLQNVAKDSNKQQINNDKLLLQQLTDITDKFLQSSLSTKLADTQSDYDSANYSANDPDKKALSSLQQLFTQYSELPHYQGFYLIHNSNIVIAHKAGLQLPENYLESDYLNTLASNSSVSILMVISASDQQPKLFIITKNYWAIVLALVFILTMVGYFIGNSFAIKVDEIIVGVSKAGGGNYSQRISGSGSDEVAQLVVSYNRMLDNMLLATQESKEQLYNYKSILDNAADGIISLNEHAVIQEYNQSAMKMFGYQAEEIIGKSIRRLIPENVELEDGTILTQNFIGIEEKEEKSFEVIGVDKKDNKFPIELSVSVATINNSQVFTGILRDVSDRKRRKGQQQSLEKQLRTLQRQRAVETLTSGIAHDFNNILGPVLGYADMALSDTEEGTRQHKYLKHILNGAHKARELVARIMSFTRQYEHSREQVHLNAIVEDSLAFLSSSIPSQHRIKTFINTDNDLVAAESTQLTQVLVAMVTNASQAMSNNNGTLTIRLDNVNPDEKLLAQSGKLHSGEYVRLRVEDTGSGMDALTRASVFEPFFSTRDKKDGSGLGLSVANGIITNFGGEILVDSEVGKGSTFSVFLPVVTEKEITNEKINILNPISNNEELILFIDDDDVIADMGRDMLESLGYEVAVSVSSEKALEMFKNDPEDFDLIITDQSMPVLTGTQLAKEFKKIRPDIPIVLVTGFSASLLKKDLEEAGIEYYISKPLVMNELGEIVMKALNNA